MRTRAIARRMFCSFCTAKFNAKFRSKSSIFSRFWISRRSARFAFLCTDEIAASETGNSCASTALRHSVHRLPRRSPPRFSLLCMSRLTRNGVARPYSSVKARHAEKSQTVGVGRHAMRRRHVAKCRLRARAIPARESRDRPDATRTSCRLSSTRTWYRLFSDAHRPGHPGLLQAPRPAHLGRGSSVSETRPGRAGHAPQDRPRCCPARAGPAARSSSVTRRGDRAGGARKHRRKGGSSSSRKTGPARAGEPVRLAGTVV